MRRLRSFFAVEDAYTHGLADVHILADWLAAKARCGPSHARLAADGGGAVVILAAVPATARTGMAAAAALGLALAGGVWLVQRRGAKVPCRCFGSSLDPLGWRQVARNGLLAAAALFALAAGLKSAEISAQPPERAVAIITGLVFAIVVIFLGDIITLMQPVQDRSEVPVRSWLDSNNEY